MNNPLQNNGRYLKFAADRRTVGLVAVTFALQLTVYATAPIPVAILFSIVYMATIHFSVGAATHNQQHHNIFHSYSLNRIFELLMGMQTRAWPYSWTLHHILGHHPNYINQPPEETPDESCWTDHEGNQMSRWQYTLYVGLRINHEIWKVGKKHPKVFRKWVFYRVVALAMIAPLAVYDFWSYFVVFWLTSWWTYFGTVYLTYRHHAGLRTKNPFEASYNIMGRFFNILSFNLGYHTAHHYRHAVHWSLLPELHEEIKEHIPAHCYMGTKRFLFF